MFYIFLFMEVLDESSQPGKIPSPPPLMTALLSSATFHITYLNKTKKIPPPPPLMAKAWFQHPAFQTKLHIMTKLFSDNSRTIPRYLIPYLGGYNFYNMLIVLVFEKILILFLHLSFQLNIVFIPASVVFNN